MKTDFLKGLNLSQEVIDKIMAENGKDIAAEQKKAEKITQERDSYKLKAESLETQVNDANAEIQKWTLTASSRRQMIGKQKLRKQRVMQMHRSQK